MLKRLLKRFDRVLLLSALSALSQLLMILCSLLAHIGCAANAFFLAGGLQMEGHVPCVDVRSANLTSSYCLLSVALKLDAENNWKDSCKVSKLILILEDLQKKKEKSIVFSQFTSFFDLLEIPLNHKGMKFLRYDGRLSQKHKEKVLKEFSESQDKLVCMSYF